MRPRYWPITRVRSRMMTARKKPPRLGLISAVKAGVRNYRITIHALMWFMYWKNLIATVITAREHWPRWARKSVNRLTWCH